MSIISKISKYILLFPLITSSYATEDDEEKVLGNLPISQEIIEDGRKNYSTFKSDSPFDIDFAVVMQNATKDGKFENLPKQFMIYKDEITSRDNHLFPIMVTNFLRTYIGYMDIYEWDVTKSVNGNMQGIDQYYYKTCGRSSSCREKLKHCTTVTYTITNIIGTDMIKYNENQGFSSTEADPSHIWYGVIDHIRTNEAYRNKGLATFAIKELVDYIFKVSSCNYIVTAAAINRPASYKAFKKVGFIDFTHLDNDKGSYYFFKLDETETLYNPLMRGGSGGNLYITRHEWLKAKS